jgi:hypothetical protein
VRRVFCSLDVGAKRTRFPLSEDIFRETVFNHGTGIPVVTCTWHVGERGAHTPPVYIYTVFTSVPVTSTTGVFLTVRCVPVHTHIFQQYRVCSTVCKLKTETFICGMYKNYFPSKYEGTVPTSPQPPHHHPHPLPPPPKKTWPP